MPLLSFIIILAGSSTMSIAAIIFWKYRTLEKFHTDAIIIGEQLKVNLTVIRWDSEMVLEQDFGRLNFAQMEHLHEENQTCERAIANLRRLLQDKGLDPTFTKLQSITRL